MKLLRYCLGPELIWILACMMGRLLVRAQKVQPARYDGWIESSTYWPVLVLILTMLLYNLPIVPKHFLFLRITIATLLGTHFLLNPVLSAHSKGGPGIGTIYIVAYLIIVVALVVAFIVKSLVIKS